MRLHLIEHGEISTIRLTPERGIWTFAPERGAEIRFSFPQTEDGVLVACGDRVDAGEPADDASRRIFRAMRETSPASISWIASGGTDDSTPLTVQSHRFHTAFRFDPMALGVDEQIVERVARLRRRSVSVDEVCAWLADELTLPPQREGEQARAIATGSPSGSGRKFRLLGGRVAADIVPRGDVFVIDAVVNIKANRQGYRPPEFLLECNFSFEDASVAAKVRKATGSQLDQLVAETDSYMGLWGHYQDIERANLTRRARQIGWIDYVAFEPLASGLWLFTARDREALEQFNDAVADLPRFEIEAAASAPRELVEDAGPSRDGPRAQRVAAGELVSIHRQTAEILVRPIDEDSDVIPPKRGALFPAMQGDRTRLQRREAAANRIRSTKARLPQLCDLLEGKATHVRRTDRVKAMSRAALDLFEHEPTPAQKEAIAVALNTPDMAVIQGPPGTGKTTVLAAIQTRLAELAADSPQVAGRTLLTSFQHDAVDHAAGMSLVYRLPAIRFGGRGRSREGDERVKRWAQEQREHVRAQLAGLPEERPLALFRSVRDEVASCAAGLAGPEELVAVVDRLLALPTDHLPTAVWESLRAAKTRVGKRQRGGTEGLDRELQEKSIRGIRVTDTAFSDDGPRKARTALRRLEGLLSDDEQALLQAASEAEPGEAFERVQELAALRDRLLDRVLIDEFPGDHARVDMDTLEALNGAVDALGERMRRGPGGVADAIAEFAEALESDPLGLHVTLRDYASVYAATCQQAVGHQMMNAKGGDELDVTFENVIVDEAARANPLDLFIPMSLAGRRIVLVGDHRQLPHLLEPDVERELSVSAGEATQAALRESLFERMFAQLRERELHDGVRRVVTLDQQFRMHPVLGEFVSSTFYGEGEAFSSPRPASEFVHDLDGYQKAGRPVCAAWRDIPLARGGERSGRSKARPAEATWIAKEVARLLKTAHVPVSIGVITFYRAQLSALQEALISVGICEDDADVGETVIRPEFRTLERDDGRRDEWLRIGTVDAFQGKEFDVVFLSVTRCNDQPGTSIEQQRRKYGHLLLPNRLCVAMSRQRRLLVAVGDKAMFASEGARDAVPGLARFLELCGGDHGIVA